MAIELGLVDTVRMSVGTVLEATRVAAESHPFYLCLGFAALWLPILLASRINARKHREAGIPPGAAWLSSALAVALPLLLVFLGDRLLGLTAGPSLENRFLAYFSPAAILGEVAAQAAPAASSVPAVSTLRLVYPAAGVFCLLGTLALVAFVSLFVRGGLGVSRKGEEVGGWMRLAGHWSNRGAEKRFGLWAQPLSRGVFGLCLFAAAGAIAGHLSPLLWIVATVACHGFMMAASDALAPKPVDEEEEKEAEEEKPAAAPVLPGADTLEGIVARALDASGALAQAQEAAAARTESPEAAGGPLFREILAGLGIGALYRHQAQALEVFLAGSNVLLCTPPGSGRAAIRDALAMHAVLAEGVSVLFLCRSAEEADAAHKAFRARSEQAHWRWNVQAIALSGREGLDLDRVQPSIVFAGWDDVHARLLADAGRFGFFLRSLRLVAIPGVERYQGPSADHLGFLLARLRRVAAEAAGPAALAGEAHPRLLMIADPIGPDVARLAERIAAEPVTIVGEESDGAPVVAVRHVWLRRADGTVPTAEEAALELKRAGAPWCAVGLEAELGGESAATDPRLARAVLARADSGSVALLPLMLRHYGSHSKVGSAVVAFWLPGADPLSRLLPGAAGEPLVKRLRPPRLVVGSGSRRVASDHAACALAEAEWPLEQLEEVFGAAPARQALEGLRREGPVVAEKRPRLDAELSEVGRVEVARAHKARPHRRVAMGIVGRALRIEDRSTGRLVLPVPAERALAAGFPERILEAGARRYRMLPVAEQERRAEGVLWAEREARPIVTVPVRRIELEPVADRRRADLGVGEGEERRAPARRALAGLEFSLSWPRVRIRERIQGFRNVRERAVVDAGAFPEVIDGVHEGRAAVLGLSGASGWEVTPAGLHALAHLFRAAMPAVLRAGSDDLDVVDLSVEDEPAIAFVDLHPGGGGWAEAMSLDAIRALARLSLAIVRGCECRKVGGCPNCVRVPECRSPVTGGERAPSRREAERLLCQLLDPGLLESGEAVVYEDGGEAVARGVG